MAIWAGPIVWKYAAPIIGATAAAMSRAISSFAALFKETPSVAMDGSQEEIRLRRKSRSVSTLLSQSDPCMEWQENL